MYRSINGEKEDKNVKSYIIIGHEKINERKKLSKIMLPFYKLYLNEK